MGDNYAKRPLLYITYPGVPNYHPDEAPLDCLAEILGQGKNSIFYKNMKNLGIFALLNAFSLTAAAI